MRRPVIRAVLATVVAACALFGLLGFGARPAAAHATFESSDPSADALLPSGQPPAAVTLNFDEQVQVPDDAIKMFDANGEPIALGASEHGDSDRVVTASVPSTIDDGTYVVTWRVTSADSHPVTGGFTFSVGEPTAGRGAIDDLLGSDQGQRAVGVAFAMVRTLAFLSVLVLVGGIAFVRARWRDAADRNAIRMLFLVMWALAIATALAGIGLEAAYVAGRGFSAMFDTDLLGDVMRSHFGEAWLARAILAAVLFPFVRRPTFGPGRAVDAALVVAGVAMLATISYAGHATTGRWIALAFVTDLGHLGGAAIWLGGLTVLALALWLPAGMHGTTGAVARFSKIAGPAIGVVAVTGIVQGIRQVGSVAALFDTTYGRLLIAKLVGVGLILVAASASRAIVRQRLAPALATTPAPGAARAAGDDADVRHLRNAIFFEVAVAVVVLALTAVLVNTEPARATTPTGGFETTVEADELWFDVSVTPARAGTNQIEILPRLPDAGPAGVLELTAEVSNAERDIAPIEVPLSPANASEAAAYAGTTSLPFPGEWTLDIRALRTEIDETSVRVEVPIS